MKPSATAPIAAEFGAEMARLGPFGSRPRLAAGVSGGADSTALALLAAEWAAARQGDVTALIVDHGLRAEAADEAAQTAARLAARGIAARTITLAVPPGAALQARARAARLAALTKAATEAGCLHLLLGHQAADQAETLAMRAARGPGGAEGIAAWTARSDVILVRPLLRMQPEALRDYLTSRDIGWVEDPSNQDRRFERVRVRKALPAGALPAGASPAGEAPELRRARELEAAAFLARHATISPLGFATIHAAAAPPAALAALLRVVAGAEYPPRAAATARLAAALHPATLHGVRISPAPDGWRLTREPAACAPEQNADDSGALPLSWDGRFTLDQPAPRGSRLGALGTEPVDTERFGKLPALVRRSLAAWRRAGFATISPAPARFTPPAPACPHPFFN